MTQLCIYFFEYSLFLKFLAIAYYFNAQNGFKKFKNVRAWQLLNTTNFFELYSSTAHCNKVVFSDGGTLSIHMFHFKYLFFIYLNT